MKIAFHFDSHAPQFGGFYGPPIYEKFFKVLLKVKSDHIHIKIFDGDLLRYPKYFKDLAVFKKMVTGLLDSNHSWKGVDENRFVQSLLSTIMYVICVDGITKDQRDQIHDKLKRDNTYLGAIQVYEANKVHWDLYGSSLIPRYRYIDGELRILYAINDDSKDLWLEKKWKTFPFKSVVWEDQGYRYTIFDNYDSFEYAKRLAELDSVLAEDLDVISGDVLLQLGDLDPRLQSELSSALRALNVAETPGDLAHASLSCRRFLQGLADILYAPLKKGDSLKITSQAYRNRLRLYAQKHLVESDLQPVFNRLNDLNSQIKHIDELANKGIHGTISREDATRLFKTLILLTHDLLSLRPPPLATPLEPYSDELSKMVSEFLKKFPSG